MQHVDNQAGSPSHEPSHSLRSVAHSYLLKEWPSAILVAAVVFIIHQKSGWLDAVDGYAFMAIGQFGFVAEPKRSKQVVALLIDSDTHETRYRERAPLSRCELLKDLTRLYDASPHLVAIDIDISPAIWTLSQPKLPTALSDENHADLAKETPWQTEIDCEENLYRLIESGKDSPKPKTVIITPFEVSDRAADLKQRKERWQERMKKAGVKFGRAELPLNYGLVIEQYPDPTSFAAHARAATSRAKNESRTNHIDPRQYARVKPVLISDLDRPTNPVDLKAILDETQAAGLRDHPYRIAFFGAAYGKDDLFLTPIGEVYGVEAQAASYLSDGLHHNSCLDFLGDVLIAFVFGIGIAYFWSKYFSSRFSDDAQRRQLARLWIVGLVVAVVLMGFLISLLSLWLLARLGVWASPIPIAVGMLIDSFVSGSIDQAIHSSEHDKQALIARMKAISTEPLIQRMLEKASAQRSHEPKNWQDSLIRIFGGDIYGLWKNAKFAAAWLLAGWSLMWLLLIGWAIIVCIH